MSFSRSVLLTVKPVAVLLAPLLAAVLLLGNPTASNADLKEDIERLKEEREQLQAERERKARSIDAATAEANEVAEALAVLNAAVNQQVVS